MKKNKIISMLLVTTMVVSVGLTGCGATDTKSTPTSEKTVAEEPIKAEPIGDNLVYDPSAPVNDGKEIEINLWLVEDVNSIYEKWTAEYQKIHPNVKFNLSMSGWGDYWNKLPISLQTGTGPDMFYAHNAKLDVLLQNTAPYPKESLPKETLEKDFMNIDTRVYEDNIYYVDMGYASGGIYYNKKMWQDASLTDNDIPQTWDDLINVATKLKKIGPDNNIDVNGFDFTGITGWLLVAMNLERGEFMYKEDGLHTNFNNPISIENASLLKDMAYKHELFNPQGASAEESFGNQRSAMIYGWAWVGNYLRNNFPDVDYGFFPNPTFDGKTPAAYDRNDTEISLGVSKVTDTEAQAVAFDFLKYCFANDDLFVDYSTTMSLSASKYSVQDRPELQEDVVTTVISDFVDRTLWVGTLNSTVDSNISSILNDGILLLDMTPEEVCAMMDEETAKIVPETTMPTNERRYKYADEFNK